MSSLRRACSVKVGAEPSKLIVLAADKHIAVSLEVLIGQRRADLGIRPISFDVRRHPESDPGCRTKAVEFLRPLINQYRWALVVFDHQGCGSKAPREEIQQEVEFGLERNGWQGRSKAIVIAPELESWVWSPTGDVARALGWGRDFDQLRAWLEDTGLWPGRKSKPTDPKEATRRARPAGGRSRGSGEFGQSGPWVDGHGNRPRNRCTVVSVARNHRRWRTIRKAAE